MGFLVASENVHKIYPISSGLLTLDHMGTPSPLKNQNFENRALSCFKLAQLSPVAKIS